MAEQTLSERLEETRSNQLNKSAEAIAALDAAESGNAESRPAATNKKKKKKKAAENVGTGQSSFDLDAAIAKIQLAIDATDNPEMKAKLAARIQALKDNAL